MTPAELRDVELCELVDAPGGWRHVVQVDVGRGTVGLCSDPNGVRAEQTVKAERLERRGGQLTLT